VSDPNPDGREIDEAETAFDGFSHIARRREFFCLLSSGWNFGPARTRLRSAPVSPLAKSLVRLASEEQGTFTAVVQPSFRRSEKAMSDLLMSLLKLSAVPARFGLLAADAALSLVRSVAASKERTSGVPSAPFTETEINAAAHVIEVCLFTGRDLGFQNMLQMQLPAATIRAMAEAALIAARNARLRANCRVSGIRRLRSAPWFSGAN
jgi:hypothetical protein